MNLPDFQNVDIFQGNSFNGIVPGKINPEIAYKLVLAYLSKYPGSKFLLAHDMKSSSKELHLAAARALIHL